MKVGIVGLGLIGGSMAKAWKTKTDVTVLGWDASRAVVELAQVADAVDGVLTPDRLAECDVVMIAINPRDVIAYVQEHAAKFGKDSLVIDCAGTKRDVCEACFPIAQEHGFCFIGGHPMAGSHKGSFANSRANLFSGAPMVIVPPTFSDIVLLDRVKKLLLQLGFGKVSVTTAERHDSMIAFTSQLAHVVSNAYIKSPTALEHKGFSAGSYKDLTRVAWLNPTMWSQLFMENSDFLLRELDSLIDSLQAYRRALADGDGDTLERLLAEGRDRKQEVDGR
ncbi:MAG: prephenate dehydrogenase [Clostridia bacterium]|nr:prephenate dehydrogenase [Clostridia bacterium]